MKKYYFLLFILIGGYNVFGQSERSCVPCLSQGITFTTQSQVDSFPINYPNCTEVEGPLTITGSEIKNLYGLSALIEIHALFINYTDSLTCLAGLNNVDTLGYLEIVCNSALTSLTGLDGLSSIGTLSICSNNVLSSLAEFDELYTIEGHLYIEENGALTSLTGLDSLATISGELVIGKNYGLSSLAGLNNLSSVNYLTITENSVLTTLMDLEDLTTVSLVGIDRNPVISSLSGLDNIVADSLSDLWVYKNATLSTCAIQSICDFFSNPNGNSFIDENAPGCNSEQEVEDACAAIGVESLTIESSLTIYPNPAFTTITIETPAKGSLSIHNTSGLKLLQQELTEQSTTIDVSGLKSGVYLVKVVGEKGVQVGKFLKQ